MTRHKKISYLIIFFMSLMTITLNSFGYELKEAPFYYIPFSRKTLVTTKMMQKGTALEVMILKLQKDEHFLFIKCNNPCNSAVLLNDWSTCCYPEKPSEVVTLPADGFYYFWIDNIASDKAELIQSAEFDGEKTHVVFESGSEVIIRLFGDSS